MTLAQHIDALDSMVANHASTAEIRVQIDLVGRLVGGLENEYEALHKTHTEAQETARKEIADAKARLEELQKQNPQPQNWGSQPRIMGRMEVPNASNPAFVIGQLESDKRHLQIEVDNLKAQVKSLTSQIEVVTKKADNFQAMYVKLARLEDRVIPPEPPAGSKGNWQPKPQPQ